MIVTLDSKRRLTVPAALARASPGEYFDARFDAEEDAIVFRRLAGREDWLAALKECPVSIAQLAYWVRTKEGRQRQALCGGHRGPCRSHKGSSVDAIGRKGH